MCVLSNFTNFMLTHCLRKLELTLTTVKMNVTLSRSSVPPHLRGQIRIHDFFLHILCSSFTGRVKLIPIKEHVLVKPQSNKYTLPPHTIYSRPTKLQRKHRLPSNSVSRKLCCNLICIQKKKIDGCLKNIYPVMFTHTCTLPHTWIYIATRLTLLRWFGGCFLLDLVCKTRTRGPCFKNNEPI